MRKIMNFIKSNFIRSTLMLMSGTVVAQIMAVCISPIMTRLYSEAEIGEYTLILTAASMFGAVICLRYDMSIVPENDEKIVLSLIKLSVYITTIFSLLVGVGYSLYCSFKDNMLMSSISIAVWVFLILFLTGLGNILVAYNNRSRDYKLISSVNIIRELGRDFTTVVFGICKLGTLGLLISQVVSVFLGLNRQAKSLREEAVVWKNIKYRDIMEAARKHKSQPLYSVPGIFVNNFSYSVINIFVSSLFGLKELAYYSMSFRMLGLPLALISTNMSRVYFEKASREYNEKGNFRVSFLMTTLILVIIAIPMVIFLMLFAPKLFGVFFGGDWEIAGLYVRILSPMFGVRLIVSALSPTMIIVNKQKLEFLIQSIFLIFVFAIYIVVKDKTSIFGFLRCISIIFTIIYIVYYFAMFINTKAKREDL